MEYYFNRQCSVRIAVIFKGDPRCVAVDDKGLKTSAMIRRVSGGKDGKGSSAIADVRHPEVSRERKRHLQEGEGPVSDLLRCKASG